PDRLWIDRGRGLEKRFEELPAGESLLREISQSVPLVLHGIGMSICSAGGIDEEYLAQLARWQQRYRCAWVSEHLSFSRTGAGHETNAAVALPVPYDREMLHLVTARVEKAQSRLACPFFAGEQRLLLHLPRAGFQRARIPQSAIGKHRLRPPARSAQRLHECAQS